MAWYRGHVYLPTADRIWENLDYSRQPLTPEEELSWRAAGYTQAHFTGEMYDSTRPMPAWTQQVADDIGLQQPGFVFYRMETSVIMPTHVDLFRRYCEVFGVERHRVWRAIVFLVDWQPGHYFEIDGQPIMDYVCGDYVVWSADTPHAASNIGTATRYTLQITGVDLSPRQEQQGHYHDLFWDNMPSLHGRGTWLGFLANRLVSKTWLRHCDDPWMIWTGTGRIRQLETLQFSDDQLAAMDHKLTLYLYEPLSCYEQSMNRGYYHEFAHPYPLSSMRALELDSAAVLAQRHAGQLQLTVRTGDRGCSALGPSYPLLQLETHDLFLRQEATREYPLRSGVPAHRFWCGNWRWTPHRHLIMAYLSQWPGVYSWHLDAGWDILRDNGWFDLDQLQLDDPARWQALRDGSDRINAAALRIDGGSHQQLVTSVDACAIPLGTAADSGSRSFLDSYVDAAIAVVTESRFASPFANFSEKALAPMGMLRPFIMVGPHGTLSYMRELGFKTFDRWWDESYDSEPDPQARMLMIYDVLDDIASKRWTDLLQMLDEMSEVLAHNRQQVSQLAFDRSIQG